MDDFYSKEQRVLQDSLQTRPLADTLHAVMVSDTVPPEHAAFLEGRDFFFLSTVSPSGEPTVSYKGGAPGFVKLPDDKTILFPDYDGNGMFLSMGNIAASAKIGMLFIDFEMPHRVRVQATATVAADDPALSEFPGAQLIVRATVESIFVNCGRYVHKHQRVADSPYVPDADGHQPLPAWKRIDLIQDALPPKDVGRAEREGGLITGADYAERVKDGEP